ncbi:ExbD/TolR family protein [Alkalilacustris brevis]|uniref:ExbD/TolR family protein n=1 Tax=Alkalilacustris brevis TaxID=2026338 RepID=UPI000E0CF023|nr:biopolymer transporter ExbD [Alkalilacustris brevis]
MLSLPAPVRRKPGLTPMIDVVFLLLVFFMLAARFGLEGALELALPGSAEAEAWQGPPRLVEVLPEGVTLNGAPADEAALAGALAPLMADNADPVLLRAGEGAAVQRVVAVIEALGEAGLTRLVLVE